MLYCNISIIILLTKGFFCLKLGSLEIKGRAALAPMAGITDLSFRRLCAEFGASYVVSEMVSAQGLTYKNYNTNRLMYLADDERPAAIQLFGDDPDYMARGAEIAMRLSPDAIDINMGCPAPKVCASGSGHGSGSALMKDPERCGKIVAAVVGAASVPVTVKMRKGWDDNSVNAVEVAQICEAAGASMIAVHGRTRQQMYQPSADWDIIAKVKQAVRIPVIGNGDVTDAQSAARMLEQTGCDMVMIGRAALGNPWIFQQINAYLNAETLLPPPTLTERMLVMLRHVRAMCYDKGEAKAMREARKHAGWYLKGWKNAASFRRAAGQLETYADIERLATEVLSQNQVEE